MLENTSALSYREGYRINLYEIDDGATEYNNSSKSPLTVGINGVINTSEERINRIESFLLEEQNDYPAKTSWLKNLLVGSIVLIGTGALAAGCYCFYIAGRASSDGRSEKSVLPELASTSTIADDFVRSLPDTRVNDWQVITDSSHPEALRSPYSYYEDLYESTMVGNEVRQLPPIAVTESSVSAHMTEETTARQENEPSTNNRTIAKDTYYPLDSRFKKDLASFCLSGIYDDVIESYRADPKYRFDLLSGIVDKIHYYREMDTVLKEVNSGREDLSIEEKNNQILIRRKLTTLYLAAETIINKKDTLQFYIHAMKDDKNYTSEELSKRDRDIMNYFSAHQLTGEC